MARASHAADSKQKSPAAAGAVAAAAAGANETNGAPAATAARARRRRRESRGVIASGCARASGVELAGIQPSLLAQAPEMAGRALDSIEERSDRDVADVALQRRVVDVVGDLELPVAVRYQTRRLGLDRCESPYELGQLERNAAQVVRPASPIGRLETAHERGRHVLHVLQVLPAAVGDVICPAEDDRLDRLGRCGRHALVAADAVNGPGPQR